MSKLSKLAGSNGALLGGAGVIAVAAVAAGVFLNSGTGLQKESPEEPGVVEAAVAPEAAVPPEVEAVPEPVAPVETPDVAAVAPPSIDEVRLEPDGLTIIAGRAAPGSEVSILLDGTAQTSVTADSAGAFAAIAILPPSTKAQVLSVIQRLNGETLASLDEVILAPQTAAIPEAVAQEVPAPAVPSDPASAPLDEDRPQEDVAIADIEATSTSPQVDEAVREDAAASEEIDVTEDEAVTEQIAVAEDVAEPEVPAATEDVVVPKEVATPVDVAATAETAAIEGEKPPEATATTEEVVIPEEIAAAEDVTAPEEIAAAEDVAEPEEIAAEEDVVIVEELAVVENVALPAEIAAAEDVTVPEAPAVTEGVAVREEIAATEDVAVLNQTVAEIANLAPVAPREDVPEIVESAQPGRVTVAVDEPIEQAPVVSENVTDTALSAVAPIASVEVATISPSEPAAPLVLKSTPEGVEVLNAARPDALENIALDTISYSLDGDVQLAGRAQSDAQVVRVYVNNRPIADLDVDAEGSWRGQLPQIDTGVYTLRVDELDEAGQVTSRVETPFRREDPEVLAERDDDSAAAQRIVVQAGHSLWAIARERYGEGRLFVQLFEANRDRIRDPNLIFPGQVFDLPK